MNTEYENIELPYGPIRYREIGEGEPLVFVHGGFANGRIWDDLVSQLEGYRCFLPDLPFGAHAVPMTPDADLSPLGLRDIVVDFCDALGLNRVTLVGNDGGGAVCQLVVAEHPDRIDRLVLTNCGAGDDFLPPLLQPLVYTTRIPRAFDVVGKLFRFRVLQRALLFLFSKRGTDAERMDALFGPITRDRGVRRDLRKALGGISGRYTKEAAESFADFDRPVLLVWATEDPFYGMKYARRLYEAFPNVEGVTVGDSRLFVQLDQPEKVGDAIREFLTPS